MLQKLVSDPEDDALTRRWVDTWKLASPALAAVRKAEIRATTTAEAFAAFDGLVLATVRTHPPEPCSGLVEQQRWFQKLAGR